MQRSSDNSYPSDICLMLRAHGEHFWLTSHVLPVLRQLEHDGTVPEHELGAALAYLEVLWLDAKCRAAETDAALSNLLATNAASNGNGASASNGVAASNGNGVANFNGAGDLNGNGAGNFNGNGNHGGAGHDVTTDLHARVARARPFLAEARRYHTAVCALRMSVGVRVARLTGAPSDGHPHERAAR